MCEFATPLHCELDQSLSPCLQPRSSLLCVYVFWGELGLLSVEKPRGRMLICTTQTSGPRRSITVPPMHNYTTVEHRPISKQTDEETAQWRSSTDSFGKFNDFAVPWTRFIRGPANQEGNFQLCPLPHSGGERPLAVSVSGGLIASIYSCGSVLTGQNISICVTFTLSVKVRYNARSTFYTGK